MDNLSEELLTPELRSLPTEDIKTRVRLIDNEVRIFKSEAQRLNHEVNAAKERMKDNVEKIKVNRQLPH